MDPSQLDGLPLIMAALAAGVDDGIRQMAKGAVTGTASALYKAMGALRSKLVSKFGDDPVPAAALTMFEENPQERAFVVALGQQLEGRQLDKDTEVLATAREVLRLIQSFEVPEGSLIASTVNVWADRGSFASGVNNAPVNITNRRS